MCAGLACQASGEPFKPRGNRQKKKIDGMEEEEEDEEDSSGEEEQPEDDMEDLYPGRCEVAGMRRNSTK